MKLPNLLRAVVCALALLISVPAFAQMGGSTMQSTPKDKTKDKPSKSSKGDKNENKYPNATRPEPKLDMSSGDQKDLNKAADLLNDSKADEAEPIVQKVIASEKASKYAQAFAHQLQAQIYWEKDKDAEAIAEYRKAIELDSLPNDAHFQVLYQIAQLQIQDEKYAEALTTLDQWEKMSGASTADEMALKANAYYRTDKFQEAIDTMKKAIAASDKPNDSWTQILMASYFELNQYDQAAQVVQEQLAKNPTDKKLLNQLATIYIQADKPQQALDLMAKAKSQGLITTPEDYTQLAKLYAAADKYKEASATLKEGIDKGILKPSFEVYKLQGDVCVQGEDDPWRVLSQEVQAALFPRHPYLLEASFDGPGLMMAWAKKPLLGREGANILLHQPGKDIETPGDYGDRRHSYFCPLGRQSARPPPRDLAFEPHRTNAQWRFGDSDHVL